MNGARATLIAVAAMAAVAGTATAAPSDFDASFGDRGLVTLPHTVSSRVVQLARVPGSGMFAVVASTDAPFARWMHRLEDHGGARAAFNGGLPVALERANCAGTGAVCAFSHVAVAPGDKLVAAGIVGGGRIAVARWNATGAPDAGFGIGGASVGASTEGWDEFVVAVLVDHDGAVWVVTDGIDAGNGDFSPVVHRFGADGAPDESFGSGGRRTVDIPIVPGAAALTDDGRVMIAGTYALSDRMAITLFRLTAEGDIDGSYGQSGYFWTRYETVMGVFSLELLPDGTAMIGGLYGWQAWEPIRIGKAWWVEADGKSHVYHLGAYELPLLPTNEFARNGIVATVSDRQGGLFALGANVYEPFGLEGRTFVQAVVSRRTPEQLPDHTFVPGSRTTLWRDFGMVPAPGAFIDAGGRIVFGASVEHAPRRDASGTAWLPVSTPVVVRLQGGSLPSPDPIMTAPVVEYVHRTSGHYFVTAYPHEAAALDALEPGVSEWTRTGQGFKVYSAHVDSLQTGGNLTTLCRFFSGATFAPLFSHFYTPYSGECTALSKPGSGWTYEGRVLSVGFLDGDTVGSRGCRYGRFPLYRAYNNKLSGAPNHRYTADPAVLDAMIAQGWTFEGEAATRVFACLPAQ